MGKRQFNAAKCNQKQQGFILLTAIAFIVFLTLIVLSTVNISNADEKIARNSRDRDVAFAAAEAALRDAELYLSGSYQFPYNPVNVIAFNNACTNALCDLRLTALAQTLDQIDFFSSNTYGQNSMPIGTITQTPQINGVSAQPRYLIEILNIKDPSNPNAYAFRITSQGKGRSSDTQVTLQEMYSPVN
jgi:type IV pilus assembly protein PilX